MNLDFLKTFARGEAQALSGQARLSLNVVKRTFREEMAHNSGQASGFMQRMRGTAGAARQTVGAAREEASAVKNMMRGSSYRFKQSKYVYDNFGSGHLKGLVDKDQQYYKIRQDMSGLFTRKTGYSPNQTSKPIILPQAPAEPAPSVIPSAPIKDHPSALLAIENYNKNKAAAAVHNTGTTRFPQPQAEGTARFPEPKNTGALKFPEPRTAGTMKLDPTQATQAAGTIRMDPTQPLQEAAANQSGGVTQPLRPQGSMSPTVHLPQGSMSPTVHLPNGAPPSKAPILNAPPIPETSRYPVVSLGTVGAAALGLTGAAVIMSGKKRYKEKHPVE